MRRWVFVPLLSVCLGLVGLIGLPTVANAATARPTPTPTLTLTEYCPVIDGRQFYGAQATLSGFPPNTTFDGSLTLDGSGASGTFVTDAEGNFGPTGFASSEPVALATATVTWSGGTLVTTLANPCQGPQRPSTKAQCKRGGFVGFGFKNQGACVSSVARARR